MRRERRRSEEDALISRFNMLAESDKRRWDMEVRGGSERPY